jgi:hypothetical protein
MLTRAAHQQLQQQQPAAVGQKLLKQLRQLKPSKQLGLQSAKTPRRFRGEVRQAGLAGQVQGHGQCCSSSKEEQAAAAARQQQLHWWMRWQLPSWHLQRGRRRDVLAPR